MNFTRYILILALMATFLCGGCSSMKPAQDQPSATPAATTESKLADSQGKKITDTGGISDGGLKQEKLLPLTLPQPDNEMKKNTTQPPENGLSTIYFGFDSSLLEEGERQTILANFKFMRSNPSARYILEGYCDERGNLEYNQALGERRAIAVKKYLVNLGFPADRIDTISFGEEFPVDQGHDEEAWEKNRRVETKPR